MNKARKHSQWHEAFKARLAWLVSERITVHQNHDELYMAWEALRGIAARLFLEIGSLSGGSLYMYAGACAQGAEIIALDPGKNAGQLAELLRVVKQLKAEGFRTDLIRGVSTDMALFNRLRKRYLELDALHIDGAHDHETVKSDYESYGSIVREGGIVLLHDTSNTTAFRTFSENGPRRLLRELRAAGADVTEWVFGEKGATTDDQMREGIKFPIGIARVKK